MSQSSLPDNLLDFEKYFENNFHRLNSLLDELLAKVPIQLLNGKLKGIDHPSSIKISDKLIYSNIS